MNAEIFIVTYRGHFVWFEYFLRSMVKFARGFSGLTIAVPFEDVGGVRELLHKLNPPLECLVNISAYEDWPDKPMLRHEWEIMCADLRCPHADLIVHLDSDCVFFENATPGTYLFNGRAILMWSTFEWVCKRDGHEAYLNWKRAVDAAIGGNCTRETMRRHPAVHWKETYVRSREAIQEFTGREPSEYIRAQQEHFPQGFCEFITLGEIAWRDFPWRYHWVNQETDPHPLDPLAQFWSKGDPANPQDAQINGTYHKGVIPSQMIERMLR